MRRHRGRGGPPRLWRNSPPPAGARTQGRPVGPSPEAGETPSTRASGAAGTLMAWGPTAVVATICVLTISLIVMRALAVVTWPWAVVLSPLTVTGMLALGVYLSVVGRQRFGGGGTGDEPAPAPERLEPPANATSSDTRILAQHPEILAALCHGFRMKQLMPSVLGHPVTDPWAVYETALSASAGELEQLQLLATAHTGLVAKSARKDGVRLSDAQAMKKAIDAFHPCATKAEAGRGHPDCPYEHITSVFGAKSPNRDAHLRSLAPKVRRLLERRYPQLTTARLDDGSDVRFSEWDQNASKERAELTRLRTERDRQEGTIRDLREERDAALAREAEHRKALDTHRRDILETVRAEQATVVADLRATIARTDMEHTREIQRHEATTARLEAAIDALTHERDTLERALFIEPGSDHASSPDVDLTGVRVLLVGGEANQVAPIRAALESCGATLVHDDSVAAAEHVPHVQIVVFWIRYLSHPTYFGVRQRVRSTRTPHVYWGQTSPASLVTMVAGALRA